MSEDLLNNEEDVSTGLNPKQELFCQFYINNHDLFGNATLAYAEAYGYDLDNLSNEAVYGEPNEKGVREKLEASEYEKAYNVCSVSSSKLLRNPKVNSRLVVLLNEFLNDKEVDAELARVIKQNYKLESKVAGIKEYNKLRQRITDRVDYTTKGEKLPSATDINVELLATQMAEKLKEQKT